MPDANGEDPSTMTLPTATTPKRRRFTGRRWGTAVAVIALVAAGCSTAEETPTIGYAIDNAVTTYNAGSAAGAATGASAAFARTLTGFAYPGPGGAAVADTDFGTAELLPGDQQTVRYTIDPAATWSDGTAITCDDLLLTWATRSGRIRDPQAPLFTPASTAGYADIETLDCAAGTKEAIAVFDTNRGFRNWGQLFGAGDIMPAHVAGRESGVTDVVGAIRGADPAVLRPLAEFWNTGWTLIPGQVDPNRFPSSGPYRIESYTEQDGLVLVANTAWWGLPPEVPRIVIWPHGTDLPPKVDAGTVQVIDASGSPVTAAGFTATTQPSLAVEQLIFTEEGVLANPAVRRAVALCVPRADLYSRFGRVDPAPTVGLGSGPVDTRLMPPGSVLDSAVGAASVGDRYSDPDIDAAIAALASANVTAPTIRIGYLGPDQRRADEVSAIADACAPAGITIVDASAPDFAAVAPVEPRADIVLGAVGGDQGASGSAEPDRARAALRTGESINLGGYSNERVSTIIDILGVNNSDQAQLDLGTEAERILWDQMPTLPLFADVRTTEVADAVSGVLFNPAGIGAGWNMDRWRLN
ncbi:ABC transporter substrate-binding protein [Millisia brevis]|uniref:ABC transporter substrate-binding protein n=1 Tax=Millisia brevis TaxID=264148 RepID=UPI0012ECBE29|nr:ABC transporter substrate-binding protein [Millisia brevis]